MAPDVAGGTLGLIANPASGKDIRRLVASAPVVTRDQKEAAIRRFLAGAAAAGVQKLRYLPGPHRLVEDALPGTMDGRDVAPIPVAVNGSADDSRAAAAALRASGTILVAVFGGDGTCRAAATGWPDMPMLALSFGTNNAIPRPHEPTTTGLAAGLIVSGKIPVEHVASQIPAVRLEFEARPPDLALADVALIAGSFTGSRAVWDPATVQRLLLLRSDPAVTGFCAVAGMLGRPITPGSALEIEVGNPGTPVMVPLAPGLLVPVPIRRITPVASGEVLTWEGPGVLALDGEREHRLAPGERVRLVPSRSGPRLVDPATVLRCAANHGLFSNLARETSHGD